MRIGFAIVMFLTAFASAQAPVEMAQDPHHSLLLQNNLVRVFKVSLNPNEQIQVIHAHNFLMVALDDCDVAMWREGGQDVQSYNFHRGDLRFYFAGQPIGTRNNLATLCRSEIVEFLDPRVSTFGYQWFDNGITQLRKSLME
jgi:hypothetical protein